MDIFLNNLVPDEEWEQLDLLTFKEYLFECFSAIVKKLPKTDKTIIFDPETVKIMNYILPSKTSLKDLGIDNKIHIMHKDFGTQGVSPAHDQAIIVILPILPEVNEIIKYILRVNHDKTEGSKVEFHVVVIPSYTYEIQAYLNSNEANDLFKIYNWQIDLMPLDRDLMSLEYDNAFKEIYVDNNLSSLDLLAKAITRFEHAYGRFEHKYLKGDNAVFLDSLIQQEEKANGMDKTPPELSCCIIMDRNVDLLTPLCSQYTYEGLLDQTFNIKYNIIKLKESFFSEPEKDSKEVKAKERIIELSYNSVFFSKFRNMPIALANQYLKARLEAMKDIREKTKQMNQKDDLKFLSEQMEKYSKMMKEENGPIQEHIVLAEFIAKIQASPLHHEYIRMEQMLLDNEAPESLQEFYYTEIGKKTPIVKILRLLCMESLTLNGIADYQNIKKTMIHAYGFQEVFLFRNLEQAGLLKARNTIPLTNINYPFLKEKLNLVNYEFNIRNITDSSYVFNGCCPISLRLIEATMKNGWRSINEILRKMAGKTVFPENENTILGSSKKRFNMIVFIGGITYSEISAVRFLNQINKKVKNIIVTTNILNDRKYLEGLQKVIPTSLLMKEYFHQFSVMVDN